MHAFVDTYICMFVVGALYTCIYLLICSYVYYVISVFNYVPIIFIDLFYWLDGLCFFPDEDDDE